MSHGFQAVQEGMEEGVYRFEELIGGGVAADVWRARDTAIDRAVAVKVLRPVLSRQEKVRRRFKRELVVHGNLRHDNIVRVFSADESKRIGLWMSMELMDGTLEQAIADGERLTPGEATELLAPIADALDYAHSEGSVHRDVKPSNILLDEKGRPHLSDFGLALTQGVSSLTATGGLVGTRGFAAPEQERREDVTGLADVYSLTVVLFVCLTGTMPNPVVRADNTVDWNEIPSASERIPGLPEAIDAVVRKGMHQTPQERFGTPTELIEAARAALVPAPPEVVPVETPEVVRVDSPAPPPPGGDDVGPSSEASRDRPHGRRAVLLGSAVLGLLLVFGIGIGAAASGGSRQVAEPTTVGRGDIELKSPPGWRRLDGKPATGGLALDAPVNLRPTDRADPLLAGTVVTVGMSAAVGPLLLPASYRRQVDAGRGRRVPLALGRLQGYRYTGLTAPGSGDPVTVFVAPTTRGVVTMVCRLAGTPRRQIAADVCDRIAGTLRLLRGKRYRLGRSPALSLALRKRIKRLVAHRGKAMKEMRSAEDGKTQMAAAEDISVAFGKAAAGVSSVAVSPELQLERRAVVEALRGGEKAYRELAKAAGTENAAAYASAAAGIETAETSLGESLEEIRQVP